MTTKAEWEQIHIKLHAIHRARKTVPAIYWRCYDSGILPRGPILHWLKLAIKANASGPLEDRYDKLPPATRRVRVKRGGLFADSAEDRIDREEEIDRDQEREHERVEGTADSLDNL